MAYLIAQTAAFLLIATAIGLWLGWYLGKLSRQLEIDVLERRASNARDDLRAAQQLAAETEQRNAEQATALQECRARRAELEKELELLRGDGEPPPKGNPDKPDAAPPPAVSAALARAAAALHTDAPEPEPEPDTAAPDDLQKIKGIGPRLAAVLNELGIYRYRQIAELSPDEITGINERLRFKGRIEREKWVEQARELLGD